MSKVSPFLFDRDFTAPDVPVEPVEPVEPDIVEEPLPPPVPMIEVSAHEQIVAEAREEARAAGLAEGRAEAAATAEAEASQALNGIVGDVGQAVAGLLAQQEQDRVRIEQESVHLAVTIAKKLARRLVEAEPLAEIEALISDCLGPLRKSPHLVVRLHEASAAALGELTNKMSLEHGFEGRLVILGEPDMQTGDCRIEWADGGIVRDRQDSEALIDEAIARYLEAKQRRVDAMMPVADDLPPVSQEQDLGVAAYPGDENE